MVWQIHGIMQNTHDHNLGIDHAKANKVTAFAPLEPNFQARQTVLNIVKPPDARHVRALLQPLKSVCERSSIDQCLSVAELVLRPQNDVAQIALSKHC